MNAKSSRGHTICTFVMEQKHSEGSKTSDQHSTLYFVDLAGRENEKTTLVTGERLVELSFINKSLFHLANAISALGASKAKKMGNAGNYPKLQRDIGTPNFRNSKLTMVLKDCLTGNSKTFMVGTLSPASGAYDENSVTLRFASTVKNIKVNATQNKNSKEDRTADLEKMIA